MSKTKPLLEVEELTVRYRTEKGDITAVSNASFTIGTGEFYGLVGESGCGKSTIVKSIIHGLDENGYIHSGKIKYRGKEIQNLSDKKMNKNIRWKEISYIPQGSMNSLDPLLQIQDQAALIAQSTTDYSEQEAVRKLEETFEIVGLPKSRISDYPHQFSGGMQQRAIIALALFLGPELIIADEPTTALDVIMQDQIFKYLDKIKDMSDTGLLLITHDISVVLESCDKMSVMHGGQIAESGSVHDLYNSPRHPYTILLKESFPDIANPQKELKEIKGQPPQITGNINECTFVDRCPLAIEECRRNAPNSDKVGPTHKVACFRSEEYQKVLEGNNQGVISNE